LHKAPVPESDYLKISAPLKQAEGKSRCTVELAPKCDSSFIWGYTQLSELPRVVINPDDWKGMDRKIIQNTSSVLTEI